MKENHRVESLKALSQSARRKRIRRFESSARVYAYSFDNANESKLSDESSTLIYKESQRLDAPPPGNRNRDWVRSLVLWAALSAFQLVETHCNSYRQMQPAEAARAFQRVAWHARS